MSGIKLRRNCKSEFYKHFYEISGTSETQRVHRKNQSKNRNTRFF